MKEGSHYGGIRDIDRPARMEESIQLIRELWKGEPVDWDGAHHHYEGLHILPTPVQDPCPIHIAANPFRTRYADRAMKRVATLADGWMVGTAGAGIIGRLWPLLEQHLEAAGKDASTFPVTAYANVHIGDDRNECLAQSHRFLGAYYGPVFTEEMTESWTAAGTIDDCADRIIEWVEAGATRVTPAGHLVGSGRPVRPPHRRAPPHRDRAPGLTGLTRPTRPARPATSEDRADQVSS